MATTEQRSGFRLPWATDSQSDAGPDPELEATEPANLNEGDVPAKSDSTIAAADPRGEAWPTSDAPHGTATSEAASSQGAPMVHAPARPPNPLVAGLVRAMREASEAARKEALDAVAQTAKERTDEIQTESANQNAEIRRAGDTDVAEIREWSKARMARLREETEQRIADRRQRLELECEDHAARIEHRIDWVQQTVGEYESRMEVFFETLMAENDPARLAGFAEQMPQPPDLTDEGDQSDWTPSHALDAARAAAAEAAALADFDIAADGSDLEASDRLDLTDEAPEPGEAALQATAGDGETRLSVVGLVSVASIAGFKRGISKAPGVESISVSSGPGGEFIFTVRHGPTVDLREVVTDLDGFSATVTGDEAGVLSVTASQPNDLA